MTDDLSSELRAGVGALSSQLRLRFADPAESGPGFVALAMLRHLRRHGPRTVTALATSDRVTTQAISVRLKPLEEAGLVTRTADPDDGRRTVVAPTATGLALVESAEQRVDVVLDAALSELTHRDRVALRRAAPILAALACHLEGSST